MYLACRCGRVWSAEEVHSTLRGCTCRLHDRASECARAPTQAWRLLFYGDSITMRWRSDWQVDKWAVTPPPERRGVVTPYDVFMQHFGSYRAQSLGVGSACPLALSALLAATARTRRASAVRARSRSLRSARCATYRRHPVARCSAPQPGSGRGRWAVAPIACLHSCAQSRHMPCSSVSKWPLLCRSFCWRKHGRCMRSSCCLAPAVLPQRQHCSRKSTCMRHGCTTSLPWPRAKGRCTAAQESKFSTDFNFAHCGLCAPQNMRRATSVADLNPPRRRPDGKPVVAAAQRAAAAPQPAGRRRGHDRHQRPRLPGRLLALGRRRPGRGARHRQPARAPAGPYPLSRCWRTHGPFCCALPAARPCRA